MSAIRQFVLLYHLRARASKDLLRVLIRVCAGGVSARPVVAWNAKQPPGAGPNNCGHS